MIDNVIQVNDLQYFRSILGNVAKAARFAVLFNRLPMSSISRDLAYLCEATELPGRAFNTDDIRYYGPTIKVPIQTAYNDHNITIICRDAMNEKRYFDDWMEQINPKTTYDFNYRDSYTSDIHVFQFSEIAGFTGQLQATYKATLKKAYPVNVNAVPLMWAEDNYHRLQVTFAFTQWETDEDSKAKKFNLVPANITNSSRLQVIDL